MKTLVVGGSGFIGSYLMKEIEADNLDLKEGRDICDGINDDYGAIIFLACNQEDTQEAYEENWNMYRQLDEYRKNHNPYIIYISSAAVYTLTSWYALSKQLGESYVTRFYNYSILRLANVYGHGDGHGAPDRFMRGENEIHGDGEQIRDLIPVEKVVTDILKCLEFMERGIFNVSTGRGTSVNQMFKLWGVGEPVYIKHHNVGVTSSILTPGKVNG